MEILLNLIKTDGDWAVTTARIVLGVIMFAHGAQKLLGWYGGHGFENTLQTLNTYLKLPRLLGALVILTEFLGGLGLIFGFLSRLAAVGILAAMLGAVVMVHYAFGLFMNWAGEQKGNGFEYHLLAIALALVVMIKGGGALSIDHALYEHQVDNRAAVTQSHQ
jgi:putative oxidoreductase